MLRFGWLKPWPLVAGKFKFTVLGSIGVPTNAVIWLVEAMAPCGGEMGPKQFKYWRIWASVSSTGDDREVTRYSGQCRNDAN